MKSYMDILASSLMENAEGDASDAIGIIAKALDVSRDEAAEKLSALSLRDQLKVTDAAAQGDTAEILLKLGNEKIEEDAILRHLPQQPMHPRNADMETPDGEIIPGGPQTGRPDFQPDGLDPQANGSVPNGQAPNGQMPNGQNPPNQAQGAGQPNQVSPQSGSVARPAKPSGTVTRSVGTQGTGPRPIQETNFSAGEPVKLSNGKKGVVSGTDDGPFGTDTVGVLVNDGDFEMVKKKDVKPMKKIDEHVLGMTNMPSITRMLELAGMKKDPIDEQPNSGEEETAQDDGKAEEKVEPTPEAETKPAEAPKAAEPAEETAPALTIQVRDIQTGQTHEFGQEPESQPEEQPQEEADPHSEIMSALQSIEQHLPNLKVGDFKEIRNRFADIQNAVLEAALDRRRKL